AILFMALPATTEGASNILPKEHNVTVRLIAGTTPLTETMSDTDRGYVAASQGNLFTALIRPEGNAEAQSVDASKHTMRQDIFENRFYLVFTKDVARKNIRERTDLLHSGEFHTYANPSFAFSLSDMQHISIFREYTNIDLLGQPVLRIRPGSYTLIISAEKDGGGNLGVRLSLK
ncbi:MAG: hypothetical protein KAJ24_05220, partial [Candidatus Aenigmarchaeota archaeon]|nr:hypothetical protein [Candidatus Aenigmarchaeota archaeon]